MLFFFFMFETNLFLILLNSQQTSDGIFETICFLMPFIGFIFGYSKGKRKSETQNSGEILIREILENYCQQKDAHILNCITLRLENGSTTQIDHILVSSKGIFVIETKHYTGWIFGNPKSKFWTQVIFENKYSFQNPIFQNYKHVKQVQRVFEFLDPKLIHNIVVFTGDSTFKTAKIDNVCAVEELISTIEKHPDGVLSLNRIQFCVGRLEYMRLELTRKTDIDHQAYLKQKFGR